MADTVDPTSYLNDPSLTAASTNATNAQNTANSDASGAISLPDLLKQTLDAKFSNNNPLIATQGQQLKDYLNTSTQAPLDYTAKSAGGNSDVVYSPLDFANLVQGRKAAALAPLAGTNFLLGESTGGIQNIIDASSRAAQAQAATAQGYATNTENTFQHLLALMQAKTQAAQQQQSYNEGVRQFNVGQANKTAAAATPSIFNNIANPSIPSTSAGIPSSFQPLIPGQVTNAAGQELYGPAF